MAVTVSFVVHFALVVFIATACSASYDELGFFRIGESSSKLELAAGEHKTVYLQMTPSVYRRVEGVFGNVVVSRGGDGTVEMHTLRSLHVRL